VPFPVILGVVERAKLIGFAKIGNLILDITPFRGFFLQDFEWSSCNSSSAGVKFSFLEVQIPKASLLGSTVSA